MRHTISPDAPEIAVISCINDAYLLRHFGEALVTDHRRVWGYISEATAGAPFEDRLYECHSVSDALRTMREWPLPLYPAERHLLVVELERVKFMEDEDPKFFFARISRLKTTIHAGGIKKSESDIVQIILRQLPEHYDVVKTMTLVDPQLTRQRLEYIIRSAYSQRKAHETAKQWPAMCASAESPYPHALVVGRGFGTGGPWAAVACLGGSSSYSNTGLAEVACFGSSSSCRNTGLATVARRGSSSSNTGLVVVACRGSSSNSSNGLTAVGFLISINVAPMLSLLPGKRDNSNRCSNRLGESLRSEVTGRTEVAPLSEIFFGGGSGAVEEWLQSENVEIPMFSLLDGPQQSAPTVVALATAAPAAEAMTGTRVFPDVSSKGVAEAPTSSAGAASAAGGTVFPTTSVGGAARAPASADETAASKAAPATSGTIPLATPLRGAVGACESSAGAASSDAVAEAEPSTGDTTAPDASVERAAMKLTSAAGSSSKIRGERRASIHLFDPGTVLPLAVRYYNSSWPKHGSNRNSSSSSNSSGNGSRRSSNDTTSNHDSWWEATCVGALLRPFDPGKRCRRSARRGKAVLGLDLPFDRGKVRRRMQHKR